MDTEIDNEKIKLSSYKWIQILNNAGANVLIYDPDGWDRSELDKSFSEPIDFYTFFQRAGQSTTNGFNWEYDVLWNYAIEYLRNNVEDFV